MTALVAALFQGWIPINNVVHMWYIPGAAHDMQSNQKPENEANGRKEKREKKNPNKCEECTCRRIKRD